MIATCADCGDHHEFADPSNVVDLDMTFRCATCHLLRECHAALAAMEPVIDPAPDFIIDGAHAACDADEPDDVVYGGEG